MNYMSINYDGPTERDQCRSFATSISSRPTELQKKDFDLDTMGGDASLLHLISLIDAGISRRIRQKPGDRAAMYRQMYRICEPLKFVLIIIYILMSQFEKPAFCLDIIKQKE